MSSPSRVAARRRRMPTERHDVIRSPTRRWLRHRRADDLSVPRWSKLPASAPSIETLARTACGPARLSLPPKRFTRLYTFVNGWAGGRDNFPRSGGTSPLPGGPPGQIIETAAGAFFARRVRRHIDGRRRLGGRDQPPPRLSHLRHQRAPLSCHGRERDRSDVIGSDGDHPQHGSTAGKQQIERRQPRPAVMDGAVVIVVPFRLRPDPTATR